jgi:hypothetical protein
LYGNTVTCGFNITITDTQAPLLACPPNVTIGTNEACTYESVSGQFDPIMTVDNCLGVVLEHSLNGGGSWSLDEVPAGTLFGLGLNNVTYRLSDGNFTEECIFTITVVDDDAPVITCPAAVVDIAGASCVYAYTPNFTESNVTDNCTVTATLDIEYRVYGPDNSVSAYIENGTGFDFEVGISQIEYRVVDAAGNVSTCWQSVTVSDDTDPVITCASTALVSNTTDLCGYVVSGGEFDPGS